MESGGEMARGRVERRMLYCARRAALCYATDKGVSDERYRAEEREGRACDANEEMRAVAQAPQRYAMAVVS